MADFSPSIPGPPRPPGSPTIPSAPTPPRPPFQPRTPGGGGGGGSASSSITTAISLYFRVVVDGHDLGAFSGCQGLGCEVTITQREEGGVNDFVHQLPGRIKYSNITLTRPVGPDSQKVADWMASMIDDPSRTTAEIVALDPEGNDLFRWTLTGVIPARWKGPSFSVDESKVAMETLELAHHGFLRGG